jgi:hypothetical protein
MSGTIKFTKQKAEILLQRGKDVTFQVSASVTMKSVVFWDVMPCGCCKNGRFGGPCRLHHQDEKIGELGMLTVTGN